MAENLLQRGSRWYVRIAVPKELQQLRKRHGQPTTQLEVQRSLGTGDLAEAKRRRARVLAAIQEQFDVEKTQLLMLDSRPLVLPTELDLRAAAARFKLDCLAGDTQERLHRPTSGEVERRVEAFLARDENLSPPAGLRDYMRPGGRFDLERLVEHAATQSEKRAVLKEELQRHRSRSEFALVQFMIDDLSRRHSWHLEPETPSYNLLGHLLIDAWLAALHIQAERDDGRAPLVTDMASVSVEQGIAGPAQPPATATKPGPPPRGEKFLDYFDRYVREAKAHLTFTRLKDARATARQFVEVCGDKPVTAYLRSDTNKFKNTLAEAPVTNGKRYVGLPLPKAIALNKVDGHRVLKPATIRNKLVDIALFGEWLEANCDGVDAKIFRTTLPKKIGSDRMRPFTQGEVVQILNAQEFVGCESERNKAKPGTFLVRDWRYWLTFIAAYTGARLNEITQLRVSDIRQEGGVWVFVFTDEGDAQSLKTSSSRRKVPIHPVLVDLGLLDYRQRVVDAGHENLLHDIKVDQDGRRSSHAGRWFRKLLTRHGISGKGNMGGMHRWRHTLSDALRRAGYQDHQIAQVLGHAVNAAQMTAHYGEEAQVSMSIEKRHEMLARARYDDVDLEVLR